MQWWLLPKRDEIENIFLMILPCSTDGLCLQKYNLSCFFLNLLTSVANWSFFSDPNFVHSLSYGDKVYMFFRETAVENINCGKVKFSTIEWYVFHQ